MPFLPVRSFLRHSFITFGLLLIPQAAYADDIPKIDSGDTAWMLASIALVLLMTLPGLALFYAGLVRKKNVLATAMQSFAVTCLVTVLWTVCGYSLAFMNGGESAGAYIGDFSRLFLSGMDMNKPFVLGAGLGSASPTTIPESVFMMFQMTFAIITPALIAGAFAERMKFSALLWFVGLWSIVVYAPIAHWVWQPHGFLSSKGVLDYAGGTVVHINSGVAGLITALVLGKRIGYAKETFKPYSILMSLTGASLLWVGWFGFNAGSALAANGRAGMAMTATMIASAMAGLSWMAVEWWAHGKPGIIGIISGAVAGLVAITPASGYVDASGALWIGLAAGVGCCFVSTKVKAWLGYDDSLDAFGVHGIGGFIGALLTGVFATSAISGSDSAKGWIDGNPGQVWVQLQGIGTTATWCAVMTFAICVLLDKTIGLRVSSVVENKGLDASLHGETLGDESYDYLGLLARDEGKVSAVEAKRSKLG
jgi:Amt family ammonium transporter